MIYYKDDFMSTPKELLEIMACPKCKGSLQQKENTLVCGKCRLKYKIEVDIPIMLIDEAKPLE